MFVFEKQGKISCRHDVIGLPTDRMDRVIGQGVGRQDEGVAKRSGECKCAAVVRYLPLVITDHADLKELAKIFAEGQDLADTPFIGEGLARSFISAVGALLLAVDFPVGEDARTGAFVLGEINRSPHDHVIAKIARSNVAPGARRIAAGGSYPGVADLDVRSFQMPTQRKRLDPGVRKPPRGSANVELLQGQ